MLTFVDKTVMTGVTSVILLYSLHLLFMESILFAFIFCTDLETRLPALNFMSSD